MALNKFFRFPFAVTGDKVAIPDDTQLSGDVSFEQGYGPDYARDPATDPLAKNIERDKMNQILFDITTAIAEIQSKGGADFITSALNGGTAYRYSQNAIVNYNGAWYISLVAANTALPSDATKWALLPTPALLQQSAYMSAAGAGTVNAITAAFTPAITALPVAPGTLSVFVRATGANTSTTPTFKADGTTAKTIVKGNNVALLAGDIAGAGHWLELQYDPTLDKWVLQNPTHGFGGTPAQFDNTLKTATTAFVQRALGNFQNFITISTSATLTATQIGCDVYVAGANGSTITLPLANSVPIGGSFSFHTTSNSISIARAGSDIITASGPSHSLTTLVINSGEGVRLVSNGSDAWFVANDGGALKYAAGFAASLNTNGYFQLPSGFIVQFQSVATPSNGNFVQSFPIAFPTAHLHTVLTAQDDVGDISMTATYAKISTSQWRIYDWSGGNNVTSAIHIGY